MPDEIAGEEGYAGAATLTVGGEEFDIEVDLRGHFQPIDGYYHWYGRIAAHEGLARLLGGRKRSGEIRTAVGSARAEISDPDPWGRYRVTGASTPPFPVPLATPEA